MSGEPGKDGVCESLDSGDEDGDEVIEVEAAVAVDSGLEVVSMAGRRAQSRDAAGWRMWREERTGREGGGRRGI
jgi:hypothetical protein